MSNILSAHLKLELMNKTTIEVSFFKAETKGKCTKAQIC